MKTFSPPFLFPFFFPAVVGGGGKGRGPPPPPPPPPRTLTSLHFYHALSCASQAGRRQSERVSERESASTEPLGRWYVDGVDLQPQNQVVVLLHENCLARSARVASANYPSNAKFKTRAGGYAIDLVVAAGLAEAEVRPDVGYW